MRLNSFRAPVAGALALVLWSCTDAGITDPALAPEGLRMSVAGTAHLVVTEFMSNPNGDDLLGEWIEIHNAGDTDVNLNGYRIGSGPGFTPPDNPTDRHTINQPVIVPAGGYVVLGNNANTTTNGGAPVAYAYPASGVGSIVLNNSNTDWITLKTPTGVLVDSVAYSARTGTSIGTPSFTPANATSRAVLDPAADNTIAAGPNWANSTITYGTAGNRGTPGLPNTGGEPAVVTVRISWVTPGTSFTVTATAVDADGKPALTNFTWSSSDNGIATVNPVTGTATGVSLGIATLTATANNGVSGSAPLFVVAPGAVASISLSMNDPDQAPAGYTKPVFPTVRNTFNATVTGVPLVWTTSDPAVATVDSLGYVTGVAAGNARIRATAPNGVYNEQPFTVIPADAPTPAVYRNHLEFGAPTGGAAGILLSKRQFVSSYNPALGGPNWVSWNLNGSQFGAAPRCDCFSADQTLPSGVYRVVDFDYRGSGYDRGHMVQSESRTTTDQENASTFLMTNILPQAGNNNQGPWSQLENAMNNMVRTGGKEAYVIAGGIYAGADSTLKGEGKVVIPAFTWKIAVIVDAGEGLADVQSTADLQVIAVKMPNLNSTATTAVRNTPWQDFAVTVDQLEAATGYDFLANLPDAIERIVESNDRPPVARTDGPYTGLEGAAVTLDASSSTDPDGDALTYEWNFGDGSTGTGATPAHTYADNGNYAVTVVVTDVYGASDTATTSVTVFNVAPAVAAFAGATLLPGETYAAVGSFADPGADSWTATVDYGDGSGVQPLALGGKSFSLSHTYAAAGSHTVTVTVTDDEGAPGTRTATVTVLTPQQGIGNLIGQVNALGPTLGSGNVAAMNAILRNASASLNRGDTGAAINQLQAFINMVEARVQAGELTQPQGDGLIQYARRIIASLGG